MKKGSYLSCVKFRRSSTFKDSSKCERLIELARQHITNLRARTNSMINIMCEDIVKLLRLGFHEKALLRVEQLYVDQCRLSAYAKIDELCSAALTDFETISKQRELQAEIRVVVCTLIFAASRYGELPELNKIRNLFREWWGEELISTNVNLLPGNLVNPAIKEALTINPRLNDAKKLEIIAEIARNHDIVLGFESKEDNFKPYSLEEKDEPEKVEMDSSSRYDYKNMHMKMESSDELSSGSSFESSNQSREEEIVYLDSNKRLKSPPPPYQIRSK